MFVLDATVLGGSVYRFVRSRETGGPVFFDGNEYSPFDFEYEGFEITGQGTLPEPTFRVANTTRALVAAVIELNDLLNATVHRIRTYSRYLDNGEEPDPTQHFPIDTYKVGQKTAHNKLFIEFKLTPSIDVEGTKLPRRLVVRNLCMRQYRFWDADAEEFVYPTVNACPYVGVNNFDSLDQPTTSENDQCSKKLSGCRLRFSGEPLPTWAFPGAGRFGN